MINRTAIVVKPAQPFLDWLHRVDPTSAHLTLEDLQHDATVYLVPECEGEEDVRENLEHLCGQIFEEQLEGWYRVLSMWPQRRDLQTFDLWFEWSFHSEVIDLCSGPLLREEL